jgi:hypothetical protein
VSGPGPPARSAHPAGRLRAAAASTRRFGAGKILISLVAAETAAGPYLADWNETHIYNPNWPPHAKFHNGQTMSMGAGLAAMTLWQLWRAHDSPAAARHALDSVSVARVDVLAH